MIRAHLTDAEIADVRAELRGLMDDVQNLQNTPTLAIKRGGSPVLTVRPKSIRLDNQQADNGTANGPTGDVAESGTVKVATEDYTAEVRIGDRFVWQGLPCSVTTAPMAKAITGMTEFGFRVTARDRGV